MGNTWGKSLNNAWTSHKKNGPFMSSYRYIPPTMEDWRLQKGDLLEVIGETQQWFYVRKLSLRSSKSRRHREKRGYIPAEFMKRVTNLEAQPWYFGNVTKRLRAKRHLLKKENSDGAFLVWKCTAENQYYLSVRCGENVKHYKIKEVNGSFFLVSSKTFPTICALVESYSRDPGVLCRKLNKSCLTVKKQPSSVGRKDKDWEVDRGSFVKVEKMGSGEFGEVWQGVWNSRVEVAIKEFKAKSPDNLNEIEIMKQLHHERLLKLYAVCTRDEPVCLITEFMKNGTLHQYLREHNEMKDIEFPRMVNFAIQIAEGMAFLEAKKIVHRDLRAENVLLDDSGCCKIGDFGLAQSTSSGEQEILMSTKLPVKWMAPEIFTRSKYTIKCDVWSFGIVLHEIVTFGEEPYLGQSKAFCVKGVQKGYRMPKAPNCSQFLYDVMLLCWRSNSEERPGFVELQDKLKAAIQEPASEEKEINTEEKDCTTSL
ncbi:tyrosine-protein kinase SRK2 [Brienomyrus brachyistius]|uniref:tyrosine-protein kinase SRK2 n=1 Tax=Brienomyrus brachyistius TaxID=42636 RepID=UPI0020B3A1FF|nr:tyrosine-protein kinase SRK2 [Brienomyrus brachyistius]